MIAHQIERIRLRHGAGFANRLCRAAGISRATFYRLRMKPEDAEQQADLRGLIQEIALAWPSYGYRRITAELHRRGIAVNHKRVLLLMRRDNLLCLRKRRFAITTDSSHALPVYPNLAASMKLTKLNQLWVADITYVRLRQGFVYLAVILDAYSRRVIGWALGKSLEAELAISALKMALASRRLEPGLVHHSDRGVQYASEAYRRTLQMEEIVISMSRRGNPYDNARAESFMKTLKYEEVLVNEYATIDEARAHIGNFLNRIYNHERLHSALGYRPPAEFERTSFNPITTP